jgi:uncharacterized membrane protein YfcA
MAFFESVENLTAESKTWLVKWLIPTLIGISVSIAFKIQETKASVIGFIITFTCGIGFSYLFWFTRKYLPEDIQPFCIAVVAMSGEKIGKWIMYKLSIEKLLTEFLQFILRKK